MLPGETVTNSYIIYGNKVIDVDAGVKIYGNWSRANAQKSMAFFCRKAYGSEEMKYKIFKERPFDQFKNLVLRNSGNDWNETMFRDGLMTGLTLGLDIDQQAFRPATIFLNGEYWGILNMREKVNEHYIAANHDVDPDAVILMENNGSAINGSADEWWSLYSFIENNSLSIQANYDQVVSKIELGNYIDYTTSQIFYANHDWPGNNIKYWKTTDLESRWRWIMFDTDFGMGIWNRPASQNSIEMVTATNGTEWHNLPWSTLMLRKMLENTGFRNQFVNRFADLMNTTFLPERVNRAIDLKRDVISDEMTNHLKKWNGQSHYDWLTKVQVMKNFATGRSYYMFTHLQQKFKFQIPQRITVLADSLAGSVLGWKLTDSDPNHQFIFAANTILKANGYVVIANDLEKFKAVFGSIVNLHEPFTFNFGLSNMVDAIKLYSGQSQLIDEVNYWNSDPWQTYTFDELWSLELINPTKNNNSGLNWVLSERNGTPGLRNPLYIIDAIEDLPVVQNATELLQNYPNPFSEGTYIEFKLDRPGKYNVSVLNVNGRTLRVMSGDNPFSTVHTIYWDGNDNSGKPVASGVYFYRLESNGFSEMKRMVKM